MEEKKKDRDSGEGGAGWKYPWGEEGVRKTNGYEAGGKKGSILHCKKICNFYNHMIGSSFKIPICNFYKHLFLNFVKFCKN